MAKAKKKSEKSAAIPKHPAVPSPAEVGELCAEVYRDAVKFAREEGASEQAVEQFAFGEVKAFMAACVKQSKADWKAYTKDTGVHAAYVEGKKKPAKKAAKKAAKKK